MPQGTEEPGGETEVSNKPTADGASFPSAVGFFWGMSPFTETEQRGAGGTEENCVYLKHPLFPGEKICYTVAIERPGAL